MKNRMPAILAAAVLSVAAFAAPVHATDVKIFRTHSQSAFLAGSLEGISIDPRGRLHLADRVERITGLAEPFLLSAAQHPEGWVVGTGNAGKVILVRADGDTEELLSADEPEVFAVAADDDGTVWAGTSPGGKLYRIREDGGEWSAEVWLEPGETYIWAIERGPGGALLLATGTQGRLLRVPEKGRGDIVYDGDDTHLRSLLVLPDGGVLVGTAGEGWVQELTPGDGEWSVRTLYDADEPEVVALALGPDGTRYAAAVASEASLVDLSRGASRSTSSGDDSDDEDEENGADGGAVVTVSASGGASAVSASSAGSRRRGQSGPRSRLVSLSPAGVAESLWEFDEETVFDLAWLRGRLWVGTGLDGELYAWNGSQMVLEQDVDEAQVVAVTADSPGPAFATTNAAALYRVSGGTAREGVYTSAALDADQIARFGTFRWRGEVPRGAEVEASFRSGISAEPDRTWSVWTPWRDAVDDDRRGGEVSLADVPPARYAQWRLRFRAADGASPLLFGSELTYRQENLRPRVAELEILDPGEILVAANFNPGSQVFAPTSPRPDGVFTTLEDATAGDVRLKKLWKPGYRSLRWKVEDANGDDLVYALEVRPMEGAEAGGDDGWLTVAEALEDDHHVFDARVLPDGVYRFRLRASDRPDNPDGGALVAERVSEPAVVDHSVPDLVRVRRDGDGALRVTVRDAWSPLAEARVSADAGEWTAVRPLDGLLDGRDESFRVEVPDGARLLLFQVMDAAYNEVTFDLLSHAE